MTKKHYEAIAAALRSSKPTEVKQSVTHYPYIRMEQWRATAESVMEAVAPFNDLFNENSFRGKAGLPLKLR